MTETPTEKQPAWKAWTYQRRLERYRTVTPEAHPPALPGPVITSTLRAVLDIRAGRRPWRSLESLTTRDVQRVLQEGPAPTGQLKRVRICRPDPWSVEVAAVLVRPDRCLALALRWDYLDDWTLTAIEG